jgi:phage terminase Nu1 subunit (DNA packaging protein)
VDVLKFTKKNYSVNELAYLLDLSPRHIQTLVQKGILIKYSNGKYDAKHSIKNYLKHHLKLQKERIKNSRSRGQTFKYKSDPL